MKHVVEIDLEAMTYKLRLIKIASGIQKLVKGDIQTHSKVISQSYFSIPSFFFQNKKRGVRSKYVNEIMGIKTASAV
jgi:hypothetical protein